MTRIQANMLLLIAGAVWGAGFVAQSTAMENLGPLWFVALRFVVASIVVAPFALLETKRAKAPLSRRHKIGFVSIGLALFSGIVAQQYGLLTTSVTNSGFLTGLYVIMVPILSVLVLKRPPHWVIWPASLLSLGGIYLLSGGEVTQLTGGDWLTVLCALFWALQVLLIGVFAAGSGRPVTLSFWQFAVTAILALIAAGLLEPLTLNGLRGAVLEILYSGIFSSGLAFSLQVIGQRYTTPAQAAIFLSSESLFAAVFGVAILGESIPLIGYLGCALIFLAMLGVELIPELFRDKSVRV